MKITCPSCKRRIKLRRGEKKQCYCGNWLDYRWFFKKRIPYDVYLLDANIMIYADKNKGKRSQLCKKTLSVKTPTLRVGTTQQILEEIGETIRKKLPKTILIYTAGKILNKLKGTKATGFKQPSKVDLSLLQTALEHPEIHGIITYDNDFRRIAASGFIEQHSSRKFLITTAAAFQKKFERFID